MKIKSLRCMDYLEWLKQEEEYLIWSIEMSEEINDHRGAVVAGEQLQIVREIKDIISKWEDRYESPDRDADEKN